MSESMSDIVADSLAGRYSKDKTDPSVARLVEHRDDLIAMLERVLKEGIWTTVDSGFGPIEELNQTYYDAKALIKSIRKNP